MSSAAAPTWRDARETEHLAQLYTDDAELARAAADYTAAHLAAGAAAVLIVSAPQRALIEALWRERGLDAAAPIEAQQLVLLDAAATLACIAPHGTPDPDAFLEAVGTFVAECARRYPRVVVFAALVDVLWQQGAFAAIERVECCWTQLARTHAFQLLCAFRLPAGVGTAHVAAIDALCTGHARVLPSQTQLAQQLNDPQSALARLQQRASVLGGDPGSEGEESAARLAAIVASSDDAIVSKTLDGVIRSWNAGAERIFGHSAAEAIGQPIGLIIPEELRDEERQILEKIGRGERIEHFETVRVTKDGRRIPISLTVSPVRNVLGQVIGASKIARDISDRKRAEQRVLLAQQQLAAEAAALERLNALSAELWRCRTLDDGLPQMLDATIELLGADKGNAQICRDGMLELVAQRGFSPAFLLPLARIPLDGATLCARSVRDGERILVEDVLRDAGCAAILTHALNEDFRAVVSTPLLAADGSIVGVCSAHFRAPHRPSEADLRRLDLYLRQATDFIQRCAHEAALHEADRRKNEFLATLAHELRNPLAPIRYAAATFRLADAPAAQQKQAAQVMERQIAHMSRLLDDLLDLSRISHGTIVLQRQNIDFGAIVSAALETARPFVDAKRHRLRVELPDTPLPLDADPVRLAQVFSNLLINAAKYTPVGGNVTLSARREGADLAVAVRDNGIGIGREMMPRLFNLFAQARSALPHSEGGLGIGLALVKGLVALHGGSVEAHSDGPGHGSEFRVRLALPNALTPLAPPAIVAAATRTPLRVVVVDDNQDAADSCVMLLGTLGHDAHAAYNGARALGIAASLEPDVMLLDISMPDMDGYELARRIRETTWGRRTVLVAITGWGQQQDRTRAVESGFDHHLTKPVELAPLEAVLQSARAVRTPSDLPA